MDLFRCAILLVLGFVLTVAIQITVMIWGWGLTPQNWWIIIGLGVFGGLFTQIMVAAADPKKK